MPEPLLYLKSMAAAAIVSVTVVLMISSTRRDVGTTWLNSACVLGMGFGLSAGYYVLSLQLACPPASGLDRLLFIVVPAALGIELIAGFTFVPRTVVWLLRMSLVAAIPRILLHGSVYLSGSGDWGLWQAGTAMAVCSVLLAGIWSLLAWLSQRSGGVSIPFALCLSIQCAAVTVMMAGYIKGGEAALPLVATLMATTIAASLITKRARTRGNFEVSANIGLLAILGVGMVGLFGILFIGRFFGRISTASALTMLLAPLLCWVTETPRVRERNPWLVGSIRLLLVAIPLVVVLAAAKRDFDRDMSPLLGETKTQSEFGAGLSISPKPLSDGLLK